MSRTTMAATIVCFQLFSAMPSLAQDARRDVYGDALPKHAVCRIGSTRLFHPDMAAEAFSPDGKRLATVSEVVDWETLDLSGAVRLWDTATGKQLGEITVPVACLSVAFSPDGKQLATGSHDGTVRMWNLATRKQIRAFDAGDENHFENVLFSADGKLLAASDLDATYIWETDNGRLVRRLSKDGVRPLFFVDGGNGLVAVQDSHRLAKFNVVTGERQYSIAVAPRIVRIVESSLPGIIAAALSPDGRRIVSTALSPDGQRIATVAEDESVIRIWDAATGKRHAILKNAPVAGPMQFTADGAAIQTVLEDGGIYRITKDDREQIRDPSKLDLGRFSSQAPLGFSPDLHLFAQSQSNPFGSHGRIQLWDLQQKAAVARIVSPGRFIRLSGDGSRLVSSNGDSILAWDAATGKQLFRIEATKHVRSREEQIELIPGDSMFDCAGILPDGKTAIVARGDLLTVDLEAGTHRTLVSMEDFGGYISKAWLSPDGKMLAIEGARGEEGTAFRIWNGKTKRFVKTLQVRQQDLATFSHDGKRLFTYDFNQGHLSQWDVETGRIAYKKSIESGHDAIVATPTGFILTGVETGPSYAYDINGENRKEIAKHEAGADLIAVSADAKLLASGHRNGRVCLWDYTSGKLLKEIQAHSKLHMIGEISFSADGRRLATSDIYAQEVLVWDVQSLLSREN